MKYDINNPCPHCGGDPKIANPTGMCSHIHYPEAVNKDLLAGAPPPTPELQEMVDYVRSRQNSKWDLPVYPDPTLILAYEVNKIREAIDNLNNTVSEVYYYVRNR